MPRIDGLVLGVAAVVAVLVVAGCSQAGAIYTEPMPSSSVQLTPNPPHIYIAPFDMTVGRYEAGREGIQLVEFKEEFQQYFLHKLEVELNNIVPTEPRWLGELPDHGWLIGGEFTVVDQGSRAARAIVGTGVGATDLQGNVYVYDLSISKTQYILAFHITGGSGSMPSGLSSVGEPVTTAMGIGSGLKLDVRHAVEQIRQVIAHYK